MYKSIAGAHVPQKLNFSPYTNPVSFLMSPFKPSIKALYKKKAIAGFVSWYTPLLI